MFKTIKLILLLFALVVVLQPYLAECKCRMDPDAAHSRCGLPEELSNFQGHYECDDRVQVGKPRSIEDLQSIVRKYPKVKAVGVGHSWWKEQFCSGEDENAVNVVMTELPQVQQLFSGRDMKQLAKSAAFPIKINEAKKTVTVGAGVPVRMLLDFLAENETRTAPDGWTLPTFTWFIDQTIGGAVATGSHGSSLKHGSLSNLITSMNVVLANGTYTSIDRSNPHLFKAFMVQVGRLGVITDLTLKITPQRMHERRSTEMKFDKLVDQLKQVQNVYRRVKRTGDEELMYEALRPIDETQIFWYVPTSDIWKIDYQTIGENQNSRRFTPRVRGFSGSEHRSVHEQEEKNSVGPNVLLRWGTRGWSNNFKATIKPRVSAGVFDTRKAYLTMSEDMNRAHAGFTGYDQLEVSIPIEQMGDCLETVGKEIYSDAELWEGFRTPPLIRFVSEEDAYLSNTHGGPRMYINLEDYVSYNTGDKNERFHRVLELFRKKCNARMHWGKAGWPEHVPCFDGATEYPETWCDFGCAVETLDPSNKFSGISNVWSWSATRNGASTEFRKCCNEEGFKHSECTCTSRASCQ